MAAVLPSSSGEDYWSVEDILAGQERVPCKVEQPLYRLGFLSSSSGEPHLPPDTKLELPIWLARTLCTRRRKIVSVSYPKVYRDVMRTALSADPTVINLHRNGPYYYSFGVKLLTFDLPERGELSQCLLETFVKRFRGLMDASQNAYQVDIMGLTSSLDEMERHLFNLGQKGLTQQIQWESGGGRQIKKSSLVDGSRKRRRET